MEKKKILVTGAAGFIGFHLIARLLNRGDKVVGIDNINSYYDVNLKHARLENLGFQVASIEDTKKIESSLYENCSFVKLDLENKVPLTELFKEEKFDVVVNLAAQAGVRYSISNPDTYINSNIVGFLNILEACRNFQIKHLVYASSSSVYGLNETIPFSTNDSVDHPISLYAATKKSNELMAHVYSHLFNIPTTGLRFFTVYGPWGRPDMAYFSFTKAIIEGTSINIYNNGNMMRDFTYIDDIIEGIVRVVDNIPTGNPEWNGKTLEKDTSKAPFKLFNIGNSSPIKLMDFIKALERKIGKEAHKNYLPMQAGDVYATFADVSRLQNELNYKPDTILADGINHFVDWYISFYGNK